MIKHFVAISAIAACISNPAAAQTSFGSAEQLPSFEVKDGDRVIFLGSEFTERRTKFNYFEAELAARWPDRRVSFFNLGWSGDTPSGIARGYFGGADEGFKRLIDEVERIKPTIVFLNYGSNLEGKTTEQFARNYTRLYDKLKEFTPRVIAMTPPPVEARPAPWPSAINLNAKRRAAARFIRVIVTSDTTGSPFFVNLFAAFERRLRKPVQPITADGLRFTDQGYEMVADIMLRSLRVQDTPARTKLTSEKFDTLRSMIAEKNRLYFHRYRPQNETYLRGFRKHEQGQNAKEIAEFDALITQAENRIYALLNDQPLPAPIKEPEPIELSFTALDPEAQREQFTVADGLKVSLFAAEPLIKNPIHMNFDGQGRLWVATSPIYPQIKPGAKPRDEIVILEDTDNDGVADKRTVFADDLLIPTAVLPDERGGAFVANSTELLHLSDTDGDGKADQRRVIFAGFGTEDTHHILHTFRWGPDAAMYFNQSIYIHTHMETSTGVKRLMGSGIWRYNPKTGTADVMMRGLVNPWGHIFDDYGQSFATDGAGGNGINYAFPGSAYATAVGFPRVLTGLNPGQPKMCGLEIITGSHWPEDWQGTLVTNDFRGNRINRFKLSDEGSSYVSTQMPDVLTSRHRAFRPVDLKLGPDGSLFVADWYNPIINHGEVDFRDSRRDYKHGRIWRVEVADRPRTEPPQLAGASVEELLEMLKLPEQRTRHMARLELSKRRGFAVSLGLGTFVRSIPEDNYDLMLEALWTFESLGKMNAKLLEKVFNAPSHQHRAAAVRIVSHMGDRVDPAGKYVTAAIADEHPRVRLEALAALRARPSPKAADLAMSILEMPMDKNLDFALWFTMRELEPQWFPTLATDKPVEFQSDNKKLLFALRAIGQPKVAGPLVKLLKSDTLSEAEWRDVVGLVGEFGNGDHLRELFEIAVAADTNRNAALNALVQAGQRGRMPSGTFEQLTKLADTTPQSLHLAGLWKFQPLKLTVIEAANTASGATQQAAIRGLAAYRDTDSLRRVIGSDDLSVRRLAIAQLATFNEKAAAAHAAQFLADLSASQTTDAAQMTAAFLNRRTGPAELANAIKTVTISEPIASAAARRASSSGRRAKPLVDALRSVGSVKPMKTKLTSAELTALIEEVTSNGNPQRGENIYRRSALGCIKCHAIGGAGGVVGPDLVSLGASSPMDYIIESMLQPSAKIKEGYHTTTVLTDSGTQVSGKVMSDDGTNLVMRDAEDKEYVIPISSIDERQQSPTSLMPSDLVAKLPRRDFVDLIAFMSSLGKEGPFKVPNQLYARQWKVDGGRVLYSKVDGTLPVAGIRGKTVTLEIEVTTPGPIGLRVEDWSGLRITRNDLKDNLRAEKIVQDLPAGRHRFNFAVPDRRNKPLRVEILSDPNFGGRAVPVNR